MSLPERRPSAGELRLLDQVAGHKVIQTYIALADQFTGRLGYTEHGVRHANLVGHIAFNILDRLGYDRHEAELAAVAGYLHDVGNVISRQNHPQTSALLALPVLTELGMAIEDIGLVIGAIGNHEEELGHPVSSVSAPVQGPQGRAGRVRHPRPGELLGHPLLRAGRRHQPHHHPRAPDRHQRVRHP
jgi:hypothetical protein